jgi:hypothetical protein
MYKIFGQNTFATHLPNALAMLGLTWLAWLWARRAWGERAGFYAGLGVLTSVGAFCLRASLFPRRFWRFSADRALRADRESGRRPAGADLLGVGGRGAGAADQGADCAGVLFGAAIPYLLLTGQWRKWKALKPVTGLLLFLAIAAPWHIACGIINHDQGHPWAIIPRSATCMGSFFYFINEHVLRFFNLRYPHDYNKMPTAWYWLAHLVWLFPWSLFPARRGGRGMEDAAHLAEAPAPRCGRHGGLSIWTTRCAKTWPAMCCREVPHAHHLAAEPVHGVDARVLFDLDQPGVLHVSGVAAAVDADCRA